MREATLQRGQARSAELLALADSLTITADAIAAQMNEEINAAEQVLHSELARMNQSARSFIQIAEAQFNEGQTLADTFERITMAKAQEIKAANQADTMVAQADVEFMRNLEGSQQVAAHAAVAKAVADAEAELKQFVAEDMMRRASINAESRIAQAAADEQFAIADADDLVTRAVFDARIAQAQAGRNRAYAEQYLTAQHNAARMFQSDAYASAFAEHSRQALADLAQRVAEFEQNANLNWDIQLALPPAMPEPDTNRALVEEAAPALGTPLADVPVDND
jgi:hypothetical protein